jgi:hypothetical protein
MTKVPLPVGSINSAVAKPARHRLNERSNQTFRLSVEAQKLIVGLAQKLGIGRTAVLELSVRDLAEKKGVQA